jgi:PST family polysaccharide transporter
MGTVLRGAGYAAGGYALAQLITLASYVVLARLLVPEEFGVYAAATVLIGFALLITESGMSAAVVRARERFEEAANTALIATLTAGLLLTCASLASAPLLGVIFNDTQIADVTAAMSPLILLTITSTVPNAILQRNFSFVRRLVIEPASVLTFGAVAIVGADLGWGVWSLVAGQYAGMLVDVSLAWSLARWKPHPRLASLARWREMVRFGRHVTAAVLILDLRTQADGFIVGKGVGVAALGQFRYAVRIATAPFQATLAIAAYVLFPAFARIAHELDRFRAAFLRALSMMSAVAFPAGLILVPLGPPLAILVFGETWTQAGHAAAAMCAYPAGGMLNSVVFEALKAAGRTRALPRLNIVWTMATLAAMVAMLPFGLVEVAGALSFGALVGGGYALYMAHRELDIPLRTTLRAVVPAAIASTIMALALVPAETVVDPASRGTVTGLALLGALTLAGAAIYLICLRIVSPALFGSIRELAGTAARKVKRK